jgi:hypothetical protein
MPRCIYTQREFESADGEHILQNFLGAHWTSRTIVCDEQQAIFGTTIDAALEKALRPIRNLFGTRGGRGEPGPVLRKLQGSDDELYDIEPGFRARLNKPIVKMIDAPEGRRRAQLLLGDLKQLEWALSILRREVPDILVDVDALRDGSETVPLPESMVRLELNLGGEDYFRGMLKSCFNLLAVKYPGLAYEPCFDAVRNSILTGGESFQQFIRWIPTSEPLDIPRLGPIDQAIFIVSRGTSVEGVVQFFGDIVHAFQLTDSYAGVPIRCGYIVDPYRGAVPAETRDPDFSEESIPAYAEQLPKADSALLATLHERSTRILRVFQHEQRMKRIIEEIFQEVLEQHKGQAFTSEIASEVANRLVERLAGHVGSANTST